MRAPGSKEPLIGRRRFLQIVAVAGTAAAAYRFGLRPEPRFHKVARESRLMMGTQINLVVYGQDQEQCDEALGATFTRMDNLDRMLSRHKSDSELTRLNTRGYLEEASTELLEVVGMAESISARTEGAFDITVLPLLGLYEKNPHPAQEDLKQVLDLVGYRNLQRSGRKLSFTREGMGITVDGIGKGYVVDQGVATLREKGFDSVYVEAGGDLMVSGMKPSDRPWRIGIRNPRPQESEDFIAIELTNKAVATSGDYMQAFTEDFAHHHIIDPRTGSSPPELSSATVVAPTVALADGLATAAMVLGPERTLAMLEASEGCEGLLIGKDLAYHRTSGFQG